MSTPNLIYSTRTRLANLGYEAYRQSLNGASGALKQWSDTTASNQNAWCAAVEAIVGGFVNPPQGKVQFLGDVSFVRKRNEPSCDQILFKIWLRLNEQVNRYKPMSNETGETVAFMKSVETQTEEEKELYSFLCRYFAQPIYSVADAPDRDS